MARKGRWGMQCLKRAACYCCRRAASIAELGAPFGVGVDRGGRMDDVQGEAQEYTVQPGVFIAAWGCWRCRNVSCIRFASSRLTVSVVFL